MTVEPEGWDRLWQRLVDYAPHMSPQGRDYLDLARRLLVANQALMDIPDLEDETYREVESISLLMHSVGEPGERYLYELIDVVTQLLDRLYVRLEYVKWEVSPLSQLPAALAEFARDPDLTNADREILAFLAAYDSAVRTGRGLADRRIREEITKRAATVSPEARTSAQRRLRAFLRQIELLLAHFEGGALDTTTSRWGNGA